MNQVKNKVRFHYVRNHNGAVMTIASDIIEDDVWFGVAFCSPEDTFSKKHGRNKAYGRLNSPKSTYMTKFTGHSSDDFCRLWNEQVIPRPEVWCKCDLKIEKGVGIVVKNP